MLGEAGLTTALHQVGYVLTEREPDYVVVGIEAGLQTILVLTGITSREEAQRFPFLPSRIVGSVADLVDELPDQRGGSSQNGLV